MPDKIRIAVTVNGTAHDVLVEPRTLLLDFLRDELALTGAHAGCEQGVCGACTVLVDGEPTRACLMFAAQLDGAEVTTVESLAKPGRHPAPGAARVHREPRPAVRLLHAGHAAGRLRAAEHNPHPEPRDVREALSGNLCRCTGYQNIVRSVVAAGAEVMSYK